MLTHTIYPGKMLVIIPRTFAPTDVVLRYAPNRKGEADRGETIGVEAEFADWAITKDVDAVPETWAPAPVVLVPAYGVKLVPLLDEATRIVVRWIQNPRKDAQAMVGVEFMPGSYRIDAILADQHQPRRNRRRAAAAAADREPTF